MKTAVVSEHVRMRNIGTAGEHLGWENTHLTYDPDDPHAVRLTFDYGIRWHFTRELLAEGMEVESGEAHGDVQIWPIPGGQHLMLALRSPDGRALLEVPRQSVWYFLRLSYGRVPRGTERMDEAVVDAAIARMLAGAS